MDEITSNYFAATLHLASAQDLFFAVQEYLRIFDADKKEILKHNIGKFMGMLIEKILSAPLLDADQRQQVINKAIEFMEALPFGFEHARLAQSVFKQHLAIDQYNRVILSVKKTDQNARIPQFLFEPFLNGQSEVSNETYRRFFSQIAYFVGLNDLADFLVHKSVAIAEINESYWEEKIFSL